MSNASAPLMSLGDSLNSLLNRMKSADERRNRVFAVEIASYSLAASISGDVKPAMIIRIREDTENVAALSPSQSAKFDSVIESVEALLLELNAAS